MTKKHVIIIGATQGIGLGFVVHYLSQGYPVIATYRESSRVDELEQLKKTYQEDLILEKLDMSDEESITFFAAKVLESGIRLDTLILNAGIKGYPISGTKVEHNDSKQLQNALMTNTIGYDHLIRSLLPMVSAENVVVAYMSSRVSAVAEVHTKNGAYHPYRISKAASNMMIWNWAQTLIDNWVDEGNSIATSPCAFAICPGWVRTSMGGPNARLSVTQSVTAMARVIEDIRKTKACHGLFMYDGTVVGRRYEAPKNLKIFFQSPYSQDDTMKVALSYLSMSMFFSVCAKKPSPSQSEKTNKGWKSQPQKPKYLFSSSWARARLPEKTLQAIPSLLRKMVRR